MKRSTVPGDANRPFVSAYAQKKADIATGLRRPFEFKSPDAPPKTARTAPSRQGAVTASIASIYVDRGYMFLRTVDKRFLYLNMETYGQFCKSTPPQLGLTLTCEITLTPGQKRPSVTKILSARLPG